MSESEECRVMSAQLDGPLRCRPQGCVSLLLQSKYDVRLRVVSDLVQYTYNGLGNETGKQKVEDQSWYPLSPNTLGMELCEALKGYLLNN
jgi:hypothetical protein